MSALDLETRAGLHAALGEPRRLAIVDALRHSEHTPAELGRRLGMDSNLLAYHLRILADAGLVERLASGGDRRRRYLHLRQDVLDTLQPPGGLPASSVLFVCTHNSARSQLAAALWRRASRIPVGSAGTQPAAKVHPMAVRVARLHGLDLSRAVPQPLPDPPMGGTLLVTVCDRANEQLADIGRERLHWSVSDPAEAGNLEAFEDAYTDINRRVGLLATCAVHDVSQDMSQEEAKA